MSVILPPKNKMIELLILFIASVLLYISFSNFDIVSLFIFGFIWNWTGSIDHSLIFQNKRYRMSMLKIVVYLQNLFQRPVARAPEIVKSLFRSVPAGFFWLVVIFINESHMPWWAVFCGSLLFEVVQLLAPRLLKSKEAT